MREDHLEALEKMFPEGFLIVYICPNSTVRMTLVNPHGIEMLNEARDMVERIKKE